MSEQPDTIINEAECVKLENRIIEQCALECDQVAAVFCGAAAKICADAIRKLKKQEDSGDQPEHS